MKRLSCPIILSRLFSSPNNIYAEQGRARGFRVDQLAPGPAFEVPVDLEDEIDMGEGERALVASGAEDAGSVTATLAQSVAQRMSLVPAIEITLSAPKDGGKPLTSAPFVVTYAPSMSNLGVSERLNAGANADSVVVTATMEMQISMPNDDAQYSMILFFGRETSGLLCPERAMVRKSRAAGANQVSPADGNISVVGTVPVGSKASLTLRAVTRSSSSYVDALDMIEQKRKEGVL